MFFLLIGSAKKLENKLKTILFANVADKINPIEVSSNPIKFSSSVHHNHTIELKIKSNVKLP